jgi:hypothetical protein
MIPNILIKVLFNLNHNDFLSNIHFSVSMILLFEVAPFFTTLKFFHLMRHWFSSNEYSATLSLRPSGLLARWTPP